MCEAQSDIIGSTRPVSGLLRCTSEEAVESDPLHAYAWTQQVALCEPNGFGGDVLGMITDVCKPEVWTVGSAFIFSGFKQGGLAQT